MATYKYIYWRPDLDVDKKGQMYANVHMLVGYNGATVADFMKMADELRKTFPQATNDKIVGGKVFKSTSVYGYTIITWSAHIPKGKYPGWTQCKDGRVEYCW